MRFFFRRATTFFAYSLCSVLIGTIPTCIGESQNGNAPLKFSVMIPMNTLKGTENSSVYHNRLLLGAVRSDVLHVEVEGELEVELDSTHLPFTADSVLHFQVYLRTVECTVTLIELIAVGTVLLFRIAFRSASALSHTFMSPMKSSGRVESSALYPDRRCCTSL